jgi:hypothetical protein
MKALVKLLTEFIGWRWAPAVALLAASTLYVVVVVGIVPSEIGAPAGNAKFTPHDIGANASANLGDTPSNTYANTNANANTEMRPVSTPRTPLARGTVGDFGRRGFSPPLERPEPLAAPATPAPIAMPTARGTFTGIFSRIQGALRPGSTAAQALSQAAQTATAIQVPTPPPQPAPPAPAEAPPAPAAAQPAPAAPAEGAAPTPPPDNGAQPAQPGTPAPPEGAPGSPEAPPAEPAPAQ